MPIRIIDTPLCQVYIQQGKGELLVTASETGTITHVIHVTALGRVPDLTVLFGNRESTDIRLLAKAIWRALQKNMILCLGFSRRYPELQCVIDALTP
ncbi:hypothetical protein GMRT_15654 [Giardia muris]|uniref:Proteasome assembly chaperone 3 n=1 Tax=Giardia muris TaxID=5742 RepID=A0A4Z1SUY4_GIAMU|nr:hypothetical protein GMRT_15654 [Giardia muris]|eukprot:TNJ28755.1 hypothetical protein GMRT_15654 [Giardia muris]